MDCILFISSLGPRLLNSQSNTNSSSKCRLIRGDVFSNTGSFKRIEKSAINSSLALQMTQTTSRAEKIVKFLDDANDLGTIRFINISGGSVLETIGRFDYSIKSHNLPTGTLVSIASEGQLFECHLMTAKIASITMTKDKAKIGDHFVYVIRFMTDENTIALSCMLMWNPAVGPGTYMPGAVEKFEALTAKYGSEYKL